VKILAVDDHALIRAGLCTILEGAESVLIFVEAGNGEIAKQRLAEHPDIELVLLDLHLPDCDGFELLADFQKEYPALPVVVLSADVDAETVTHAIDAGASGFVPKTSVNELLVSALRLVLAGGVYVPREALRHQENSPAAHKPNSPRGIETLGLTDRQLDVLARLLEGKSNKQICRELDLAEATVKVHVRAILRALNANSRTEAVVAASKLGFTAETVRN